MWCAVGTRRAIAAGNSAVVVAVAWLAACQFDPAGGAGRGDDDGPGTPDGGGGTVELDGGTAPVACTPGETVCTDGRVLNRCSESGDSYSASVVCPFTCEGDDHCTLASNVPQADQLACDASAPRLAPPDSATVSFLGDGDGRIVCNPDCGDGGITSIDASSVELGDVDLSLFCLSELDVPAGLTVRAAAGLPRSIALLVAGRAVVAGRVELDGTSADQLSPGASGPGAGAGGGLAGGNGQPGGGACLGQGGATRGSAGGGGGGGGHGGVGGTGGDGLDDGGQPAGGGSAGGGCGSGDLVPLVGGGGGGGGGDGGCNETCGWPGGGGGGAIQIAAAGGITVSGTISATGGDGFGDQSLDLGRGGGGGGGAGGAILLEASTVTVESRALLVEGGNGGGSPAGNGGLGGAGVQPTGRAGPDAGQNSEGGAGGGGGGGRVRLNATSPPACGLAATPEGVCSSGELRRGGSIGGQ